MRVLLVFIAVLVLSVLASSRWLLQAGRFPIVAQLTASGLSFLVFGAVAGPGVAALLEPSDLVALQPLEAFGLGVCGLIVGLNLDPRLLRHLPWRAVSASALQSGLAFAWVALPLGAVLWGTTALGAAGAMGAAAVLGAAASVSSAHYAVLWYRAGRLDRLRGLSVALLAMLDDVFGLTALGIAFVMAAASTPKLGLALVVFALLLGAVSGALVAYLVSGVRDGTELAAILVGGAALVSGAAAYLRVSGLLSGVTFGATLALVGGSHVGQMFRALARLERPVYLVLLFLVGAHLDGRDASAWLLLPGFVALRFLGKLVGGRLASRVARGVLRFPREVGMALLSQGGVAMCIALEYLLLVRLPSTQLIYDVVVVAALANEVLAARAMPLSLSPEERGGALPQERAG